MNQDEILALFTPDELENGNPTTDGLRRIVRETIGPIIHSRAELVAAPTKENNFNTIVSHTIIVALKDSPGEILEFAELANVNIINTKPPYCHHAPASAGTKAEGRALRKLLGLKKVLSAEEAEMPENLEDMGVEAWNPSPDYDIEKDINGLYLLCEKLDINVNKYINSGKDKYESLYDISENKMMEIKSYLQKFQQGLEIPKKIKGFIPREN
jgi:hypothetical protein